MHCWLANADPDTAWAHRAWTEFPASTHAAPPLVILPLHGFVDRGDDLPADLEEILGSDVLRAAAKRISKTTSHLVLPPVRQVLAARAQGFFGVDPETATGQLTGIARGVLESGCTKLLLFNTSAVSQSLVASAALDIRATLGLSTYVVHAADIGMSFTGVGEAIEAPADQLAGLIAEIAAHRTGTVPVSVPSSAAAAPRGPAFPSAHRDRYLGSMSRAGLGASATAPGALAIVPLSSIEQHGPHLPVGVDAILGQALLAEALDGLPPGKPVFVAPPLTYGKCNEHAGFPGTLSLDARTLRALLLCTARDLARLGFKRIAFFNTHGGNTHVLATTLREISEELDIEAFRLRAGYVPAELDPQESAWGMHADEWETSLMLACAPRLVRMDKAVCEYPARIGDPGRLRPEKAPATFAWLTKDLSASGVLGDPTRATAEKGRRWIAEAGAALRERIVTP